MKRKSKLLVGMLCLLLSLSFALTGCGGDTVIGVMNARINENGELILTYQGGQEQNLGVVVGKDGADGKDGVDGLDGKDGLDGTPGSSDIVINGSAGDVTAASAKGLRSAVRIISNFTATVQQGGYWPGFGGGSSKEEYSSEGSGVIYQLDKSSGDAFIITNYHVVYDASSDSENGISQDILVCIYGGETEEQAISATYVGGSLYYDIAVLRIEDSQLLRNSQVSAVELADSDAVVVGQKAIAIGNAQGLGIATTAGIVSVDSEYINMTAADGRTEVSFRVMRVDTAVNSGNSGGGLYNDRGQLIGIVNAKVVYDGVESIGYAIPVNVAVAVAENIIHYCYGTDVERVQRAMLGITVTTSDSKAVYDTETGSVHIEEQVYVYEVTKNSLAEGLLQAGDVLLSASVNDQTTQITRQYHVIDMMLSVRVGDTVSFTVLRDGQQLAVDITITADCLTAY